MRTPIHFKQLYHSLLMAGLMTGSWLANAKPKPQSQKKKPALGVQMANPTGNSVVELLLTAQTKLSNEAARLQIQGKRLSKREIQRINALYRSIGTLGTLINQLKTTSLANASEAKPPVRKEPPRRNQTRGK